MVACDENRAQLALQYAGVRAVELLRGQDCGQDYSGRAVLSFGSNSSELAHRLVSDAWSKSEAHVQHFGVSLNRAAICCLPAAKSCARPCEPWTSMTSEDDISAAVLSDASC